MIRTGLGYDVHKLVEGRKLIICGVEIPYEKGLLGHSDADVALHALADAMLGAAAMRDIGYYFPDNDEKYSGADSRVLLRKVMEMVTAEGFSINNVDVTIIAQRPKMLNYIPKMIENIASDLGIPVNRVSVKATTTEHLGFEGRGEGIASQAIATLENCD
ncbi:MAG: 2-C-methyl-D-erythritol 2,4-cyclodiphosphate synthase [Muribaculum sp.]|nr:2-C-methyl-D-erythritol 2,4-cyclodiphosphate synthase [Muribaculum sp.]